MCQSTFNRRWESEYSFLQFQVFSFFPTWLLAPLLVISASSSLKPEPKRKNHQDQIQLIGSPTFSSRPWLWISPVPNPQIINQDFIQIEFSIPSSLAKSTLGLMLMIFISPKPERVPHPNGKRRGHLIKHWFEFISILNYQAIAQIPFQSRTTPLNTTCSSTCLCWQPRPSL